MSNSQVRLWLMVLLSDHGIIIPTLVVLQLILPTEHSMSSKKSYLQQMHSLAVTRKARKVKMAQQVENQANSFETHDSNTSSQVK